jgi:hypothetical protein
MWIIVAILISLLGLGIGGYFVRQNGIIERQNERLQQDSITMANHLKRIQNDSIMLSVQNDSIASQNSIILNQRDSIENSMKRLYLSNRLLYRERDNVVRANASLSLSLMKTYLSQNMPEMALVVLNDTKCNIELDSEQISDLKILKESLCDSILTSSTLLVNIIDTLERRNLDCAALLKTKEVVDFQHLDDTDFLYIHNTENNTTDTISGDPTLNFISNLGMTFIAVYQDGEQGINNLDTVFNCEKAGIRIFSLQTGKLEHFIGCWAWFPWMTYPMSLSNDGKSLIYHEEYRAFERIWFVNFDKGQRIPLYSSNSNSDDDYVISSFSPSGEWFYLNFPAKNKIEIYSSWSLKEIRTFRYEDCDSVYWDISNNICISSRGKIYTWKLLGDNKNCIFSVGSFANSVNISNKYAAVACNDGKTYVWDIILKKMIFAKEIIDAPEDVAIADGNKTLWVVSKYDGVKTIDFENNLIKSINYESGVPNAFNNPWLYMTKDGLYCICLNQNYYAIFDMKGNLIKQGILSGEVDENINKLLSEVYRPDEFCYDPELTNSKLPVLTARRVSSNGEICIEGYSNGVIKIVSIKDRNRIYSLIGGFTESCKNINNQYD